MPITPTTSTGAKIKCPGKNIAHMTEVKDISEGTVYDVLLEIDFGFENAPDWTRHMRIYGKFEKDAKGNINGNDKEVRNLYRNLGSLGVFSRNEDKTIKGVCLSEKGKFVLEDDSPIKDIAGLIAVLCVNKKYELYLEKDAKGYDKIVAFIDKDVLDNAHTSYYQGVVEDYNWRVENLGGKTTTQAASQTSKPENDEWLPEV